MSPLSLRRYRAERLLRREFEALRGGVIAAVEGRLRVAGSALDRGDLEACYAAAWQGLYMATLEGAEIANPAGWLVLVTFRRAVEERRARTRAQRGAERIALGLWGPRGRTGGGLMAARERDLAAELDDRARLRQLFEGLRGRLSEREREAAVLCYLHGLTRAEAAARMGVSETRMRKLMEGRGRGSAGVAGKVGALVASIRDGDWCEEQGSLMRALAFGVLEPRGERHGLALAHVVDCPGCRAYVASLRGLAAALPPVLAPWGLATAALARSLELAHAGASAARAAPAGGGGIWAGWGGRLGGTVSTSAGAGAGAGGAAGGGWLLAGGPIGGKLALGCLLALGVGAGCATLGGGVGLHPPSHRHVAGARAARAPALRASDRALLARAGAALSQSTPASVSQRPLASSAGASREFGPERALAAGVQDGASAAGSTVAPRRARAASSHSGPEVLALVRSSSRTAPGSQLSSASATSAAREFSPG